MSARLHTFSHGKFWKVNSLPLLDFSLASSPHQRIANRQKLNTHINELADAKRRPMVIFVSFEVNILGFKCCFNFH